MTSNHLVVAVGTIVHHDDQDPRHLKGLGEPEGTDADRTHHQAPQEEVPPVRPKNAALTARVRARRNGKADRDRHPVRAHHHRALAQEVAPDDRINDIDVPRTPARINPAAQNENADGAMFTRPRNQPGMNGSSWKVKGS